MDGHFVRRETWRVTSSGVKGRAKRKRTLEEAYFGFASELPTNQKYTCQNCGYVDHIADDAAFYYVAFADFPNCEPAGFECPHCGGPMAG